MISFLETVTKRLLTVYTTAVSANYQCLELTGSQ